MSSTPFANLYYKRTVATPRACYVCNKPTATVLSTSPVVDWIYTCDTHLSDPGFVTLQAPAASPAPSASPEEIARLKAEWEAKQKKKQEQAEKDKKDSGENKDGEKKEGGDERTKTVSSKPTTPTSVTSGSTTPKHDKYVLHRQFYTMRLTDHRRRRQQKEVEAVAPKLAGVSVPKQVG